MSHILVHRDNLLSIAKGAIIYYFKHHDYPSFDSTTPKRASFVTLKKMGDLRGCIGSIIATQPLEIDVSKNAINAAFFDPRFPPLQEYETKELTIEISVLSPLHEFEGNNEEFIEFLEEKKPGVYIKCLRGSATFLPQVWEQISDAKSFMLQLSLKAGLSPEEWNKCRKYYYFVDKVEKQWHEIEELRFSQKI